jgi:D-galactonate transporter
MPQTLPISAPSVVITNKHQEEIFQKITRRIIPILFICLVLNFIDRINIGFAQLQMKQALGFSDAVYGLGAGIFFVGYFLFEVPSNIMLQRIGARKTILRIMLCWGIVSACTMFVRSPMQFYIVRFLLGAFEAGLLPGILLYLTFWFPKARRAKVIGLFMAATSVGGIITGPVSGWILQNMGGVGGLAGWQWLFVIEGVPSSVVGIFTYFYLDDSVRAARWLSDGEKRTVAEALARDEAGDASATPSVWDAFKDAKVYVFSLAYMMVLCGANVTSLWAPSLIKGMGVTNNVHIGLLSTLPYVAGGLGMIFYGRRSDRLGERRWHFAVAVFVGALCLCLAQTPAVPLAFSMLFLSLAVGGNVAGLPVFWAAATSHLSPSTAAAGIAIISSIGNLSGILAPAGVGAIATASGNLSHGMFACAAVVAGSGLVILLAVPRRGRASPRSEVALTAIAPGGRAS